MTANTPLRGDHLTSLIIGFVRQFTDPLVGMWPWFSVKLAIVRDQGQWHCIYLGVAGQFAEPSVDDFGTGPNLITARLSMLREDLWAFLTGIEFKRHAHIRDWAIEFPAGYNCETNVWTRSRDPHTLSDIRCQTEWSVLTLQGTTTWLSEPDAAILDQTISEDLRTRLNWVEGVDNFLERQLSVKLRPGQARFDIQLPLALKVERDGTRSPSNDLLLQISGAAPLAPCDLELRYSSDFKYRDNMPSAKMELSTDQHDTWWSSRVTLPITGGLVQLRHPLIARPLPHEFQVDPTPKQLESLLAHIYDFRNQSRGLGRWHHALRDTDGAAFEVALHNAIARFGWAVLFTGAVDEETDTRGDAEAPTEAQQSATGQSRTAKGTQPQTEGFDLVVLDHERKRVLLISAKGSPKLPGNHEVGKLNDQVAQVASLLTGWEVYGRLVCNRVSAAKLEGLPAIESVGYSGTEWVQLMMNATTKQATEYLLWPTDGLKNLFGAPLAR